MRLDAPAPSVWLKRCARLQMLREPSYLLMNRDIQRCRFQREQLRRQAEDAGQEIILLDPAGFLAAHKPH
jgi:hypothetical protein